MTTADALMAAVCAAPDDDLPRLVYADWLDENGDADHAEFIRLQVERARGAPAETAAIREQVLLDTHAGRWLAPLRLPGGPLFTQRSHGQFRRGFIEVVWMPARWFLEHAERLFAAAPVVELRVVFDDVFEFWLMGECRRLTRLRALDVCDQRFGAGGVVQVCRSPHVRGLEGAPPVRVQHRRPRRRLTPRHHIRTGRTRPAAQPAVRRRPPPADRPLRPRRSVRLTRYGSRSDTFTAAVGTASGATTASGPNVFRWR